jgi:hypothetical protein
VLDVSESNDLKTEHPVMNRIERDCTIRRNGYATKFNIPGRMTREWGYVISSVLGEHTSKGSLLLMTRREEGENI